MVSVLILLLAGELRPPRDAGILYVSARPLIELQACAVRKLAHQGTPLSIPADGGVDIDLSQPTPLGQVANEARFSLMIREADGQREMRVTYRHPYSAKAARSIADGIRKRCFPELARQ